MGFDRCMRRYLVGSPMRLSWQQWWWWRRPDLGQTMSRRQRWRRPDLSQRVSVLPDVSRLRMHSVHNRRGNCLGNSRLGSRTLSSATPVSGAAIPETADAAGEGATACKGGYESEGLIIEAGDWLRGCGGEVCEEEQEREREEEGGDGGTHCEGVGDGTLQ